MQSAAANFVLPSRGLLNPRQKLGIILSLATLFSCTMVDVRDARLCSFPSQFNLSFSLGHLGPFMLDRSPLCQPLLPAGFSSIPELLPIAQEPGQETMHRESEFATRLPKGTPLNGARLPDNLPHGGGRAAGSKRPAASFLSLAVTSSDPDELSLDLTLRPRLPTPSPPDLATPQQRTNLLGEGEVPIQLEGQGPMRMVASGAPELDMDFAQRARVLSTRQVEEVLPTPKQDVELLAGADSRYHRPSRSSSDEDEEGEEDGCKKKLRLSKEAVAILESFFRKHQRLNVKNKGLLARKLNLSERQVEVWFQNRRARTKMKRTEQDREELQKTCHALLAENQRLSQIVRDLSHSAAPGMQPQQPPPQATKSHGEEGPEAMRPVSPLVILCPSCQRTAVVNPRALQQGERPAASCPPSSSSWHAQGGAVRKADSGAPAQPVQSS